MNKATSDPLSALPAVSFFVSTFLVVVPIFVLQLLVGSP